ncbi:hypothetical protein BDW74DRAFT_178542 [Aspergillus multicolor]|uniref:uncharacterized protein n=1 Tax=Aspergillus multicolor TaxID=41759 RepID=UPI003CCCC751
MSRVPNPWSTANLNFREFLDDAAFTDAWSRLESLTLYDGKEKENTDKTREGVNSLVELIFAARNLKELILKWGAPVQLLDALSTETCPLRLEDIIFSALVLGEETRTCDSIIKFFCSQHKPVKLIPFLNVTEQHHYIEIMAKVRVSGKFNTSTKCTCSFCTASQLMRLGPLGVKYRLWAEAVDAWMGHDGYSVFFG